MQNIFVIFAFLGRIEHRIESPGGAPVPARRRARIRRSAPTPPAGVREGVAKADFAPS